MQKHEAHNLSDNEHNFYERNKQNNATCKWFFKFVNKNFIIYMAVYLW